MDETHYRKAFEEAVNILQLRTALPGWKEYITGLVRAGLTAERCPECSGSGRREVRAFMTTVDAGPCDKCAASGIVAVQAKEARESELLMKAVSGFIYSRATAQILDSRVLALAEHFECAQSTVVGWATGINRPHPTLDKQILAFIAERREP